MEFSCGSSLAESSSSKLNLLEMEYIFEAGLKKERWRV